MSKYKTGCRPCPLNAVNFYTVGLYEKTFDTFTTCTSWCWSLDYYSTGYYIMYCLSRNTLKAPANVHVIA